MSDPYALVAFCPEPDHQSKGQLANASDRMMVRMVENGYEMDIPPNEAARSLGNQLNRQA